MAELVDVGDMHLLPEDFLIFIGEVPQVFEKENDLGGSGLRSLSGTSRPSPTNRPSKSASRPSSTSSSDGSGSKLTGSVSACGRSSSGRSRIVAATSSRAIPSNWFQRADTAVFWQADWAWASGNTGPCRSLWSLKQGCENFQKTTCEKFHELGISGPHFRKMNARTRGSIVSVGCH